MTCKNEAQKAKFSTSERGGAAVHNNPTPMITYKYLELDHNHRFVSPVSGHCWEQNAVKGEASDENDPRNWVWSCTSPHNPELASYRNDTSVLVSLEVWGKVLISDNGVGRSQYARIVGYDPMDYYSILCQRGEIGEDILKQMISPTAPGIVRVIKSRPHLLDSKTVQQIMDNRPSPEVAFWVARNIYKRSDDTTRQIACRDPQFAYLYALHIDQAPREDTRQAACGSPQWAYFYAKDVDKSPRNDTRLAACQDPLYACFYARDVDYRGRDDTRQAACKDPSSAYLYAVDVDKRFHPLT